MVVVPRLDRLCRSTKDICDLLVLFNSANTAVISITQALDTAIPAGRRTMHLLTAFGQFEREIAGERTRDKFALTRSSGKWQVASGKWQVASGSATASHWATFSMISKSCKSTPARQLWRGTFLNAS
jgi:DNA invertase Pin-like site-specific DNA recombinase